MTETPAPSNDEKAKAARAEAVNKGYTAAMKQLRELHVAEFNTLRVKATKALGYDWTPEPTPAEKALADAKALLAAHPDIAEDLRNAAVDAQNSERNAEPISISTTATEEPTE